MERLKKRKGGMGARKKERGHVGGEIEAGGYARGDNQQ